MQKSARQEYMKRHDNTLKILAIKWAREHGLLPENVKWYREKWERGKILEIMERNRITLKQWMKRW